MRSSSREASHASSISSWRRGPDFWVFSDLLLSGKLLRIEARGCRRIGAGSLCLVPTVPDAGTIYSIATALSSILSPARWNNDPNGLVYHRIPLLPAQSLRAEWGNMHWGHAVMIWCAEELPVALYPRRHGDGLFGSAVDSEHRGASERAGGSHRGDTSTGRGECIAYSTDRGAPATEYPGNR